MSIKAKKLRREGFVTGNLFGRELEDSIPLKFDKAEIEKLLKVESKGGQVMLEVAGETYDALIKEVDYNPLKGYVDEIDFQALVSGEMVHSVAEVVIHNQSKVVTGKEHLERNDFIIEKQKAELQRMDAAKRHKEEQINLAEQELKLLKTVDIRSPKTVISVHFSSSKPMAMQIY